MHSINFNILDFIIKDYEYNFRLTPKGYLILGLGLEPRSSSSGFIKHCCMKVPFTLFHWINSKFRHNYYYKDELKPWIDKVNEITMYKWKTYIYILGYGISMTTKMTKLAATNFITILLMNR